MVMVVGVEDVTARSVGALETEKHLNIQVTGVRKEKGAVDGERNPLVACVPVSGWLS